MFFHRLILSLVVGLSLPTFAQDQALITVKDTWRYLPGFTEASVPVTRWRAAAFDDSEWFSARAGFSYGFGFYDEATVLGDMPDNYKAVFFRKKFFVVDTPSIKWLVLRLHYSHGFVAYLNGVEVARQGLSGATGTDVPFNVSATNSHDRVEAVEIDVSPFIDRLVMGANVLAIQAHNAAPADSTFCLVAELLANFKRGPFIQNASSKSVQIIWRTPVGSDSVVHYGPTAALGATVVDSSLATNHAATLTNLDPGTTYFYRVQSSAGGVTAISAIESFRTLKVSGNITFAVFGDSGYGSLAQDQVAGLLANSGVDRVMHVGDVIYPYFATGWADSRCLSVYWPHMKSVPYYFAIGNHDLGDPARAAPFLEAFYLPTNNVPFLQHSNAFDYAATSPEHFYSFDHGDAHFAVLFQPYTSQYLLTVANPQYIWLTNDLAASGKLWKFLFLHVPMAGSGAHRFDDQNFNGFYDQADIMNVLLPVARRYGVQLIFAGHEHSYERLNPIAGVHHIVTGGGGVALRGLGALNQFDPASCQFWSAHHYVKVTLDSDTLELQAININNEVFDAMTIRRTIPTQQLHQAAWHTPLIETAAADDGDGNINGQSFDLVGKAIPTLPGHFSNLGKVYVNNDRTNLYIGLANTMLYPTNNIFLFVESPRISGVTNLAGLGNGIVDPAGEGVDGLDFLENLSFTNFAPSVGCILGDEFADGQFRSFARPGLSLNIGQGIFRLDSAFSDLPAARLQQFNRSPQAGPVFGEQNADFIELAIPLSSLGNLQQGDTIKLGAVVAGGGVNTNFDAQTRDLDSGFLGLALHGAGRANVVLEGVRVQLAIDPDPDSDGLTTAEEQFIGTNPFNPDSDGDTLPDGWEVRNGLEALSADGLSGSDGDPDGDGFSNQKEYLAGTDPRNPASLLRLELITFGTNTVRLSWRAVIGKTYQLEVATESPDHFTNVSTLRFPQVATSTNEVYDDTPASGQPSARFYRLKLIP